MLVGGWGWGWLFIDEGGLGVVARVIVLRHWSSGL